MARVYSFDRERTIRGVTDERGVKPGVNSFPRSIRVKVGVVLQSIKLSSLPLILFVMYVIR